MIPSPACFRRYVNGEHNFTKCDMNPYDFEPIKRNDEVLTAEKRPGIPSSTYDWIKRSLDASTNLTVRSTPTNSKKYPGISVIL